jgi:hypothetical protein
VTAGGQRFLSFTRPDPFGRVSYLGSSGAGPALGFLLEDQAVGDLADDRLGFRVEAGDGFKLQLEVLVGTALALAEDELVGGDAYRAARRRQPPDPWRCCFGLDANSSCGSVPTTPVA